MHRVCSISLFAVFTFMTGLSVCLAQDQLPASSSEAELQHASFERSLPRGSAEVVHFGRRPARVGDEIGQTIAMEVNLATSVRQGNALIERSRTAVRTAQRRNVVTTEVTADLATAVVVRYLEASKQVTTSDTDRPDTNSASVSPNELPVAGKTYRCRREASDPANLIVTDANGHIPPMNEYEIVAQHMEMLGRANPLAEFLAGKSVAIGDTIKLPQESAEALFHAGDHFGEVTQFDLTLEKTETRNGVEWAVFLGRVEAVSSDSSQMRLQVEGPLVIETGTCRAVQIDLSGPIGMSETRGTYSTAYQMLGTGRLNMNIASAYRDAKR